MRFMVFFLCEGLGSGNKLLYYNEKTSVLRLATRRALHRRGDAQRASVSSWCFRHEVARLK